MNISDIIALAKNGYKPNDIRELIELSKVGIDSDVSGEPDVAPETSEDEDNKPIDYKSLYEESIKEIENIKASNKKLADDLKKAQKDNSNKDISDVDNSIEDAKSVWENFIKSR